MAVVHNKSAYGKDLPMFRSTDSSAEQSVPQSFPSKARWKIMVIDDEQSVHDDSLAVLNNFVFKRRELQFIHGYTSADARDLMKQHPDTAVILLDIAMESDTAGLKSVKYIREQLRNTAVRIIIRTARPCQAPEHEVVRQYDINGYLDKGQISAQDLQTALVISLRSFDDICTIGRLAASKETLKSLIKTRTRDLSCANAVLHKKMREQVAATHALRRSEARLADVQRVVRVGHFEWSVVDNRMAWSAQIYQMLGIQKKEGGHTLEDFLALVIEEERALVAEIMDEALVSQKPYYIEHSIQKPSGGVCYVRQQGDITVDAKTGASCIVGILQDVTDWRLAEVEMRKLSLAVEQAADGIMITDCQGVIEYVNPAMTKMTGYSKREMLGQTPRLVKSDQQDRELFTNLWRTIRQGKVFNAVVINQHKSGHCYYEEKTITPQKNGKGEIINYISSGKDISERVEAQKRLKHLAHHDSLTGLPNRLLLQDRLQQAIARARWHDRKIAVLFLDMDRFKVINDTLGHAVGDMMLKGMAARLLECVREGDTVARFGGDEFAVILNDVAVDDDVPMVASKILSSLAAPFHCHNRELFVTTSIGISVFPQDGDSGDMLLKKSDTAMYGVKRKGRNAFQFYTEENEQQAVEWLTLESDLRRALERDEFLLHYQPQFNLSTAQVQSYEALLRWQRPGCGLVSPVDFIPLLEDTGMILAVGEWVLLTACAREKASQQAGKIPKRIAVNISMHQFRQKNFVGMVREVLERTDLRPQFLELEVTEGVLIDDIKEAEEKLEELHAMGVYLSIDDFGTGYSSMNYLRKLPFDQLKIDRSFIADVTTNQDDGAIATAIITLAHSMGLTVVAEGVENTEQLHFLDKLGCDVIQGYLCSQPVPTEVFSTAADNFVSQWQANAGPFSQESLDLSSGDDPLNDLGWRV